MKNIITHSVEIDGKTLSFEHGRLATAAQGSALLKYGQTQILGTCGIGSPRDGIDFFPLVCDFETKFYATGKIKGSRFLKREGRAPESAILTARMMDRPIRPMFEKGIQNEVQIIATHFQSDGIHSCTATAINAGSAAILASGFPFQSPIGAVRVGMRPNGDFYCDPTFEEIENGQLDLVVAGTADAITMVEAGAQLISDEKMIAALEFAHQNIAKICTAISEFAAKINPEKIEPTRKISNQAAADFVEKTLSDAEFDAVSGTGKKEVKSQLESLEQKLLDAAESEIAAETFSEKDLREFFGKQFAKSLRRRVFEKGVRLDGRKVDEIRPITVEVGVFDRLHGSALFQRGETQSLTTLTVAGPAAEMIIDDPDRPETTTRYFHHYNFPPFSVGETRMLRGPGRREIGHGALAERALRYVLPSAEKDNFPYVLRCVSEILTCNGSSSMASVCGSTLALMDGGIPIKTPVAGIAMGLLMQESGDYEIMSDIQAFEDFDGDMDFKVAGSEDGITALQLDIKVSGLSLDLLRSALEKSRVGRAHILAEMKKVISTPRNEMSNFAPRVEMVKINPDFIRDVIGKGGETIQGMQNDFNVEISVADDGAISVSGVDPAGVQSAIEKIESIAYEPEPGDIFEDGVVKSVMDFGVFVEFLPGKEALVHVSEMADHRVNHPSDLLKEGDKVKVKLIGTDKMGRIKLTMKDLK